MDNKSDTYDTIDSMASTGDYLTETDVISTDWLTDGGMLSVSSCGGDILITDNIFTGTWFNLHGKPIFHQPTHSPKHCYE